MRFYGRRRALNFNPQPEWTSSLRYSSRITLGQDSEINIDLYYNLFRDEWQMTLSRIDEVAEYTPQHRTQREKYMILHSPSSLRFILFDQDMQEVQDNDISLSRTYSEDKITYNHTDEDGTTSISVPGDVYTIFLSMVYDCYQIMTQQ